VQQAVSKLFQKSFSIYFAIRNLLIMINEYILLRIFYWRWKHWVQQLHNGSYVREFVWNGRHVNLFRRNL